MKMRSRLLILKLAASRALPSDCVNIRRSVNHRKNNHEISR